MEYDVSDEKGYGCHHGDEMGVCYLEYHLGDEVGVWLLAGQELPDHFIHDVLRWEEVSQKCWQQACDHPCLVGVPLLDSDNTTVAFVCCVQSKSQIFFAVLHHVSSDISYACVQESGFR